MSKGLKNKSGFTLNGFRWDHLSINNDTSCNKFKYFKYVDIHNLIMILKNPDLLLEDAKKEIHYTGNW